jgi:hypothetical protein
MEDNRIDSHKIKAFRQWSKKDRACIPSLLINSEVACSMNELSTNILAWLREAPHSAEGECRDESETVECNGAVTHPARYN